MYVLHIFSYIRASEGVDPVTGEKLTAGQRVAAGAMAAAGFIPIVGWGGRILKGGSTIYKTAKGMNAADQALDVYKTFKTFSNLEKAEMGIYGLVSANGFSEYLTGKDLLGNELADEQQQNSLNQALGLLAVGGIAYAPQLIKNEKMIREETINKAHELATKTKAGAHSFIEGLKGGMRSAFTQNNSINLAFAGDVPNVPVNVIDTSSLRKVFDGVLAKFSVKNVSKGTGEDKYNTDTMKHIYHGEINKRGKAVGYHHESMMGGKIVPGTEKKPDKNGVYMAKVEIAGVKKIADSSFFPKEWNRVDVLKAIDEAYQTKQQIGSNKYRGVTSSGIKIEMYLNRDRSIATAYPLYKK